MAFTLRWYINKCLRKCALAMEYDISNFQLTYEIIGRLKAPAIRASCMQVSCGPIYPEIPSWTNVAVCLMLAVSSPYVSATCEVNTFE